MFEYRSTKGYAILEVSGEGCANCFSLMPVLRQIAEDMSLPLLHLEADETRIEELKALEIDRVPTVLLLDNGEPFARCTGYQPEEILSLWIEAKLDERKNG